MDSTVPDHRTKREKLEALAKHPRTPPHEAAAAKRALDAMGPDTGPRVSVGGTGVTDNLDYSNAQSSRPRSPMDDLAEAIRMAQDIANSYADASLFGPNSQYTYNDGGNAPGGRQTGPRESAYASSMRQQQAWEKFLRQEDETWAKWLRQQRVEAAAASFCPACDHGVEAHASSIGCASCTLIRRRCLAKFSVNYGDWVFPKR